jgi:hypothetical protein
VSRGTAGRLDTENGSALAVCIEFRGQSVELSHLDQIDAADGADRDRAVF